VRDTRPSHQPGLCANATAGIGGNVVFGSRNGTGKSSGDNSCSLPPRFSNFCSHQPKTKSNPRNNYESLRWIVLTTLLTTFTGGRGRWQHYVVAGSVNGEGKGTLLVGNNLTFSIPYSARTDTSHSATS